MKALKLKTEHFNLIRELQNNSLDFNIGGSYSLKAFGIIDREVHDIDIICFDRETFELKILDEINHIFYPDSDDTYQCDIDGGEATMVMVDGKECYANCMVIDEKSGDYLFVRLSLPHYSIDAKIGYLKRCSEQNPIKEEHFVFRKARPLFLKMYLLIKNTL